MVRESKQMSESEHQPKSRLRRWLWGIVLAAGLLSLALPFAGHIAYAISVYFVNDEPMWKGPEGDLEHGDRREVRAGEY